MTYWTASGLQQIAQTESSGDPTAVNPASGASGLYGFLNSTWQSMALKAGVDITQYPTAASAPASVQTQVAQITPISNWTCSGCNSAAAGIAANPINVSQIPGIGDTGATASDNGGITFNAPSDFNDPGAGSPGASGSNLVSGGGASLTGSSVTSGGSGGLLSGGILGTGSGDIGYSAQPTTSVPTAVTSGFNALANQLGATTSGFMSGIENWLGRGFVMLLAIVVAGVGLWMLAGRPTPDEIAGAASREAA